jgi:hypothetical protein
MTKREAGSKGGSVKTPAKVAAVKRNGRLGGRPVEFCEHCDTSNHCEATIAVLRKPFALLQLSCTKEKGHKGEHVACGMTDHAIHRWDAPVPVEEIEPSNTRRFFTKYGPTVKSRDRGECGTVPSDYAD